MPTPDAFHQHHRLTLAVVLSLTTLITGLLLTARADEPGAAQPPPAATAPSQPAQPAQPAIPMEIRNQVLLLNQARAHLRDNEREPAVAKLQQLLAVVTPGNLIHHTAAVLHSDVTGGFADRMAPWARRQVVSTVVLVPDEASFIAAARQWTPDRFWPVLIEDDWYAPLFIEAFKPDRVVRWQRPEGQATAGEVAALTAAAIKQHNEAILTDADGPRPPGLVVIDPVGQQRTGGLALALGRRQPVMALAPQGDHRRRTTEAYVKQLAESVLNALIALKLADDASWSAVTLAADFPFEYDEAGGKANPLAVDDYIGRDDRQIRRAATGRLIGTPVQSVYQAMGGLFLTPDSALLLNTYGYDPKGNNTSYREYHLAFAAPVLGQRLPVTLLQNSTATVKKWSETDSLADPFGLYWINSAFGGSSLRVNNEWRVLQSLVEGAEH